MLSRGLFWLVVAVFIGGQALLLRSAWLLQRSGASPPPGVPRSHGGADLAWTALTAALTAALLYYAYLELP